MQIEFVIAPPPGLELAALEHIPQLRFAYSRGRVTTGSVGAEGYWFSRFGVGRQSDWPAAAYRLSADQAGESYWLCADPVHLQVDRDQLLLAAGAVDDLGDDEAQQLVAMLNRHFAPDGLSIHALSPLEWVLEAPRALELAAPPPWRIAGRPAGPNLPRGADAAWARRVANEAQMLLYQSPVNHAREAAGKAPVNSLWLWGGGRRQAGSAVLAPHPLEIFSSAKHVRELARFGCISSQPLPTSWTQLEGAKSVVGTGKSLIDLTEISAGADWEAHLQTNWLLPAEAAAKSKKQQVWCTFLTQSASAGARLYHGDLFHFFVRNSLAQYVDNPQNQSN